MRKDLFDVTMVLDRSGSMSGLKKNVIEATNKFIASQEEGPGEVFISLSQFDHEYESLYEGKRVKQIEYLTDASYTPRGSTALYDAIGRTINRTESRLEAIPKKDRPASVLFVIQTDGFENASKEYTKDQINDLITKKEKEDNWKFIYLGANQDAIMSAGCMGINPLRAVTYNHTSDGYNYAASGMACSMNEYRATVISGGNIKSGRLDVDFVITDKNRSIIQDT